LHGRTEVQIVNAHLYVLQFFEDQCSLPKPQLPFTATTGIDGDLVRGSLLQINLLLKHGRCTTAAEAAKVGDVGDILEDNCGTW
jgi:hypothetical protein